MPPIITPTPACPPEGMSALEVTTYTVRGNSWMDREWSSSALGREQLGWDWFALQLSNDHELMYYRFRRTDNALDRFSYGAVVLPTGGCTHWASTRWSLKCWIPGQAPGAA